MFALLQKWGNIYFLWQQLFIKFQLHSRRVTKRLYSSSHSSMVTKVSHACFKDTKTEAYKVKLLSQSQPSLVGSKITTLPSIQFQSFTFFERSRLVKCVLKEKNAENKSGKFSNFLSKWFLFSYKETKVIFLAQRRNKQLKTNRECR